MKSRGESLGGVYLGKDWNEGTCKVKEEKWEKEKRDKEREEEERAEVNEKREKVGRNNKSEERTRGRRKD